MINDLDIVQWEYLLSPEFELINSAGKPLTGGWIEVYLHGTRNKYYCASDFSGTLHPFQIPLDSLGSNIVLACPDNSYDVYVYNKYGSLIMSRYNVKCHGGGSGSSTYVGDRLYYGQFKATDVATQAGLTRVKGNIDVDDGKLELKQDMSYHITLRGEFVVNDVSNVDTVLSYIEYSAVKPINVNVDYTKDGSQYFEISYDIYRLAEDMDYPVSFMQSNGLVKNLVVEVHSLSNLATTAAGEGSEYEPGWGIVIQNSVISVDPSILEDFTTTEEVMAIVSGITGIGPGEVYNAGDYISIEDNTISVTGIDPNNYVTYEFLDEAIASAVSGLDDGTLVISVGVIEAAADDTEVWDEIARLVDSNKYGVFVRHPNYENAVGLLWRGTRPETHDTLYHTLFLDYYGNGTATVRGEWVRGVTYRETRSDVNYLSQVYHDGTLTGSGTAADQLKVNHQFVPYFEDLNIATVTAIQVATGAIPEMPEEEEVEFEEINLSDYALASAIPDVSDFVTHEELIEAVSAVTGLGEYGQFYCAACTGTAELGKVKGTLSVTNDGKVSLKKGCSYHVTVRGGVEVDPAANTYGAFGLTEFISGNSINSNIDRTIEDTQYFEISYDLYNLSTDTDYQFAFTNVGGSVNALYVEIHEIGHVGSGSGGAVTGTAEYDAGWGINIVNNVISVDPSVIPEQVQSDWDQSDDTQIDYIKNKPDLEVYSTHEEVYNATVTAVQVATGVIPELPEEEEVVFEEINLSDYALASAIPDVSNFTTHTEVYEATVTAVQVATAAIPEEEEVEFEEINLNDYALASAIPDVSNLASHTEVYEATVTAINLVTGIMPEAQVQSDWAQNDSNQVDYIKNKPDEYDLVAGQNVSISVSGTNVVISSTGGSGGGGTYSEGFGIDISNNEIAIDPSIVALASADPNIFFAHVKATNTSYTSTTEYTSYADVKAAYDAGKIIYCVLHTPLNWIYAVLPLVSASNHDSAQSSGDLSLIFIAYSSEIWKKIYVVEYDGMMKTVFLRAFDSQADWNQQYSNHPNYIKNKPSIPEIELNDDSQVTAIDGHALAGGSGGTSYTPGTGIDITNDVISVDNTVALKTDIPDVSNLATKTELTSVSGTLQTEIEAVSAIIPDEEAVEFEEINISDYALASAIPDTSDMATKTWVGNQGYLTEVPNTYATDTEVYNATVTAINVATGVIPDTEDVTFEEVDLSDYALTSAIPDVSNFTTHAEVYVATVTAVQVATGVIPDTSDMATKTWVGNQGYLTSVPSNYVTETELTGAVSGFQNKLTGINDVQVVASLPASPVSNTLYLIPEGV